MRVSVLCHKLCTDIKKKKKKIKLQSMSKFANPYHWKNANISLYPDTADRIRKSLLNIKLCILIEY